MNEINDKTELILLYDKQCPICERYAMYVDLKKMFNIRLLNARQELDRVKKLREAGYNIESGFILVIDGEVFQGYEAMMTLERITAPSGVLDRVKKIMLKIPGVGRIAYPIAKFVRFLMLRFKGIDPKIV